MRPVTEADFRLPEFRDAKVEDYEFDGTGCVVRKDRWEKTVRKIVGLLDDANWEGIHRGHFTCDQVVGIVDILLTGTRPVQEEAKP